MLYQCKHIVDIPKTISNVLELDQNALILSAMFYTADILNSQLNSTPRIHFRINSNNTFTSTAPVPLENKVRAAMIN